MLSNPKVSKTNLAVHEDKNRVPFVKVGQMHIIVFFSPRYEASTSLMCWVFWCYYIARVAQSGLCPVQRMSWMWLTRVNPIVMWLSQVSDYLTSFSWYNTSHSESNITNIRCCYLVLHCFYPNTRFSDVTLCYRHEWAQLPQSQHFPH